MSLKKECKCHLQKILMVGVNPSGLAITPNDRLVYVANNNNYGLINEDTVSVINTKNGKVIKTITDPSFNQPYAITINNEGTKAYVVNSNSSKISTINISTNKVDGVIDGLDGPSGMIISLDGKFAYVSNYGGPGGKGSGNGNTVSIVDLSANKVIGEIIVGLAPATLVLSNNGKLIYTINYVTGNPRTGTMSIIDISQSKVIGTISGFFGPFDISLSPKQDIAYVTNFGSNNFNPIGKTLSVVDLNSKKIIKNIPLGIQPAGVTISPDGKNLFVTNYNTLYQDQQNFSGLTAGIGLINIIDTQTYAVSSKTIQVGLSPANIISSKNGKYLYVTNYTSNTLNIIDVEVC